MMAGAAVAALAPELSWSENGRAALRLAISEETLAGANVNDARAAYRVWLGEVQNALAVVNAQPVPDIFIPSGELIGDVRKGMLDCYGVTALELTKVVDLTDPDSLVIQDYLGDGIEYVLLVHNTSPFRKIADLRGAHILSHLHRDMVLLPAWLGTMLAANNLPQAEELFASYKLNGSLNQVLLPVFFHRIDGAFMARRSWETARELNPQLGRDLRAVAVSPRVIPIIFAFRNNTNATARKALIDSIQHIADVPGGQQIVTLYQSHAFVVKPMSVMKTTMELVRQFERFPAQQALSRKGPA